MTIERIFDSVKCNREQLERIKIVKEAATEFSVKAFLGCVNNSREKLIAIQKFEECVMWATKAISHNDSPLDKESL